MPIIQCDYCAASRRVPDDLLGCTIHCLRCRRSFEARVAEDNTWEDQSPLARRTERPDSSDPPRARPFDEDGRQRPPHDDWAEDDDDRAPRRRRARRDDWDDDLRRRAQDDDDQRDRGSRRRRPSSSPSWPLYVLGAVGLVIVIGIGLIAADGLGNFFDDSIDPSDWKTFEAPNRCRVEMPGPTQRRTETVAPGLDMVLHYVELSSSCVYMAGYSEGALQAQRGQAPIGVLLDEVCTACLAAMSEDGEKLVEKTAREPIMLGGVPGKQLFVDLPNHQGQAVMRVYLSGDRFYYLFVAGRGYSPDHTDVMRFFDSFRILDLMPPVAWPGRQQAPAGLPAPRHVLPRLAPAAPPPPRTRPEYETKDAAMLEVRPPDPKLVAGEIVYLSDMQEFGWKQGPFGWKFGKNGKNETIWAPNSKILVDGKTFKYGLSMIPPDQGYTRICYALGKKAERFEGAVALSEDESHKPPPTRFVVLGDGKILWRSGSLSAHRETEKFSIDVEGVGILELRVYVENGFCFGSHGAWLDPAVTVAE
jgi:hypothetical protein